MKETDFQAKVILFSSCADDKPLITIQLHYPRMIHSEFLTHRNFSRNARSSRAVPTSKLLQEEIYVPHFMKNQSGMQAFEEFDEFMLFALQEEWIEFANKTKEFVKRLHELGVHKQWANRPLEWFGYIDTLITSMEWDNFFSLRLHKDAMPEIRELAKVMDEKISEVIAYPYKNDNYKLLIPGEWHLPYILPEEDTYAIDTKLALSVARCARVSYAPFDGNPSLQKEIERYEKLRNADPMHSSPFEHQAVLVDDVFEYHESNLLYPWLQYRKLIELGVM